MVGVAEQLLTSTAPASPAHNVLRQLAQGWLTKLLDVTWAVETDCIEGGFGANACERVLQVFRTLHGALAVADALATVRATPIASDSDDFREIKVRSSRERRTKTEKMPTLNTSLRRA